jgi:cysteine-S-conjugate beta-lyase
MNYDFDRMIDRRANNSVKWNWYNADVLPLWVADMDFVVPEAVIRALRAKVEHGIFGYEASPPALLDAVCRRMERLYRWQISPDDIVVVPGIVSGINVVARAVCSPGQGVLIQPPVYPPFLDVPRHNGLTRQLAELSLVRHRSTLHYEIDFTAYEAAITDATRLFLLCQPHNPTGQIYGPDDLRRMADICQRHDPSR